MSEPFLFAVMTPDREVAGGRCDFLVIPTTQGELGVLADHAALLAEVAPGELRIHKADAPVERVAVEAGIVEVRDNIVRLLVFNAAKI